MTLQDDHGALPGHVEVLLRRLVTLGSLSAPGEGRVALPAHAVRRAMPAAELETFGRMAKRDPRLQLLEWAIVEAEIAEAREASSYFWFLSGEPVRFK